MAEILDREPKVGDLVRWSMYGDPPSFGIILEHVVPRLDGHPGGRSLCPDDLALVRTEAAWWCWWPESYLDDECEYTFVTLSCFYDKTAVIM